MTFALSNRFFSSTMQPASQKDAPPRAFGGVRTVDRVCSLCVCPCKLVFLLPGGLLGDMIHLMFAYLLLPGKQCMFMVIMRSCLKIDQHPSFSCPSVCPMICRCCQHECLSLLLCKLFTPSLLPYVFVVFSEAVPCSLLPSLW